MNSAIASHAVGSARVSTFGWRRLLVYGLLWATATTGFEFLLVPPGTITDRDLPLVMSLFATWGIAGIGITCIAMVVEARLSALLRVVVIVLIVLITRTGWVGPLLSGVPNNWSMFSYSTWVYLVTGGPFLAFCVVGMRAERTGNLLSQAEIARSQTETLLDEAELQTLQGHVDPAFLVRIMGEVERRYANDAEGADRLVDQLVSFLRSAMPAVGSGRSTLAAELALVQCYARLCSELEPQRVPWRVVVDEALPELPFPPLLLLPVLDQLAAATRPSPSAEVSLSCRHHGGTGTIMLTLDAPGAAAGVPLSPQLVYRLRVGLRAVFGDAWALLINEDAAPHTPALVLTLPSALASPNLEMSAPNSTPMEAIDG